MTRTELLKRIYMWVNIYVTSIKTSRSISNPSLDHLMDYYGILVSKKVRDNIIIKRILFCSSVKLLNKQVNAFSNVNSLWIQR